MLLAACGLAAPGAATAATPVEAALQGATQTVGATAAAVDQQTAAVAPGVGQAAAGAVTQVTQAPAVRTVVETVSEPIDRVASRVESQAPAVDGGTTRRTIDGVASQVPIDAVETAASCVPACATTPESGGGGSRSGAGSPSGTPGQRADRPGPRSNGAIDRRASRREGGAAAAGELRLGDPLTALFSAPSDVDLTAATTAPPRAAASSTNADSGDDGEPGGNPLFGPPATGGTAAPAGLTLLAFAMLVGLLGVVLRRVSRPLHMSPSPRGLAAILTPIERPG